MPNKPQLDELATHQLIERFLQQALELLVQLRSGGGRVSQCGHDDFCYARPCVQLTSTTGLPRPLCQTKTSPAERDRGFESTSLQRGVRCEPDLPRSASWK
jgi:hypothetical protein